MVGRRRRPRRRRVSTHGGSGGGGGGGGRGGGDAPWLAARVEGAMAEAVAVPRVAAESAAAAVAAEEAAKAVASVGERAAAVTVDRSRARTVRYPRIALHIDLCPPSRVAFSDSMGCGCSTGCNSTVASPPVGGERTVDCSTFVGPSPSRLCGRSYGSPCRRPAAAAAAVEAATAAAAALGWRHRRRHWRRRADNDIIATFAAPCRRVVFVSAETRVSIARQRVPAIASITTTPHAS